MRRFASWTTSHRKTVILAWIAGLLVFGMIAKTAGSAFSEDFSLPASDSKEALDLLEQKFPAQSGEAAQIVFKSDQGIETPAVERKMKAVFAKVEKFPHVSEVASPYAKGGGAAAISKDGKIAYATIQFDAVNSDIDKNKTDEIISIAQGASGQGLQVELGGQPIEEATEEEGEDSSFMVGLLAAVIVLLITFGSVVAMGLPIVTALLALGVGISVITLGTHLFPTANFAPFLALMIGLGVGVDYALFILTRFRNGLDEGLEPRDAAIAAVDTAGRAVLFAGITVIISLLGMFLLGLSFLYGVAMAAAIAVFFTMIAALTLLPALLTIVGRRVDRLRLPGFRGKRPEAEGTRWYGWSRAIQRRPVLAAVLSGGLLLLLCVPVLSLRLGTNDAGTDPPEKTTRKAYDLLADGFGPGFNGPLVIAAALPAKGDDAAVVALRKELDDEPGVAKTTPIVLNEAKNTAVFQAYPTTSPESADTTDLLDHIRGEMIPPIEEKTGAQVHVGGINAIFEDFGNAIAAKLPLFIGVVVLLSALLLMMVFRSVWVPLKAMVMNLLSIGAAFGLVVAVFQWGWGASLIGVEDTGPIISFFPIFLFAIIFGLSMDYEVFLMSRIHEEWEHKKDATEAVTRGLALTGRVITAAAAIMVTVFASFMLGEDRIIKLFGLGLASAVFIDAVIIRSVLVPAIMQLLGKRAWYFPAGLDRLLPRLHVEPAEGDPSPTGEHPVVVAAESEG
jgi:putative drug exporter of the RND superfamily